MKTSIIVSVLGLVVASASLAGPRSPYAGEEARDIKALSSAEIADLLAGKGMGYAKAAELNGYPGPAHVLELADQLGLTAGQRLQTQAIFERMAAAARTIGAQVVEVERGLDASFHDRLVTPDTLSRTLEQLAGLQARLRNVHLQAHLEQTRLLTPGQVARYGHLRGYGDGTHGNAGHQQHDE